MTRALTSASNLSRRLHCPGSEIAEAPFAEKDSEYSVEGVLLHSAFFEPAGRTHLNSDQIDVMETAEQLTHRAFIEFRDASGIPEDAPFKDSKEITLLLVDDDGNELPPGHADLVRTWPDYAAAFVADAKFGYNVVEEAADNIQLAHYACGVFQTSCVPLDRIGVGIVQPRAFGRQISTAVYQSPAISMALDEIKRIADACKSPDAPRKAGPWCDYCKAKTACETFKAGLFEIELLKTHAVSTADNAQLARLKSAIQFANKIEKEVNAELLRRIDEGTMPGWGLKNNGATRDLFDATGLFLEVNKWLKAESYPPLTASAFENCRRITWEPIELVFAGLTGMAKKKAAETLKTIAANFVVEKEKSKSPILLK